MDNDKEESIHKISLNQPLCFVLHSLSLLFFYAGHEYYEKGLWKRQRGSILEFKFVCFRVDHFSVKMYKKMNASYDGAQVSSFPMY